MQVGEGCRAKVAIRAFHTGVVSSSLYFPMPRGNPMWSQTIFPHRIEGLLIGWFLPIFTDFSDFLGRLRSVVVVELATMHGLVMTTCYLTTRWFEASEVKFSWGEVYQESPKNR